MIDFDSIKKDISEDYTRVVFILDETLHSDDFKFDRIDGKDVVKHGTFTSETIECYVMILTNLMVKHNKLKEWGYSHYNFMSFCHEKTSQILIKLISENEFNPGFDDEGLYNASVDYQSQEYISPINIIRKFKQDSCKKIKTADIRNHYCGFYLTAPTIGDEQVAENGYNLTREFLFQKGKIFSLNYEKHGWLKQMVCNMYSNDVIYIDYYQKDELNEKNKINESIVDLDDTDVIKIIEILDNNYYTDEKLYFIPKKDLMVKLMWNKE
jgi:hypothetical protein